jgi:hypothetical protein
MWPTPSAYGSFRYDLTFQASCDCLHMRFVDYYELVHQWQLSGKTTMLMFFLLGCVLSCIICLFAHASLDSGMACWCLCQKNLFPWLYINRSFSARQLTLFTLCQDVISWILVVSIIAVFKVK